MEETLEKQRDPIASTKLIVGLFFAIVGVLMTAANLGWWEGERLLRWWPVVFVVIGVIKLADAGRRLMGVILTIVGLALLAENLGWWRYEIFNLWPLLLVAGGIAMIAKALGFYATPTRQTAGNNFVAVVGVRKTAITSKDFTGARAAAFMGGVEIDLTDADIANGPAIIECFVMWGGIEIKTPETWDVIGEVVPVMAGFEVHTGAATDPKKQLIVRGTALMGGIEVKRRMR